MKRVFTNVVLVSFCLFLSSCAVLMGEKAKEDAFNKANKKAKTMGLKVGKACSYIGIGDNSEQTAVKNGKIKVKMFSVKVGGILKNCTYAYGK